MTASERQADCLFCSMATGAVEVAKLVARDDVFVIRDINPRAPVHLLVIPTKHIPTAADVTDADGPVLAHMFQAAREAAAQEGIGERGYRLAINVGGDAGMVIRHLHMHLLGGRRLGPEG